MSTTCMVPWPMWKRGGLIYINEEHILNHASDASSWQDNVQCIPPQVSDPDNHCNYNPTFHIAASIALRPSNGGRNGWENAHSSQNSTGIPCARGRLRV